MAPPRTGYGAGRCGAFPRAARVEGAGSARTSRAPHALRGTATTSVRPHISPPLPKSSPG
eukprot:364494-Chlamydomonas_euryale.AAC.7